MAMHTGSAAQSTSLSSAAWPLLAPTGATASAPSYSFAAGSNLGIYAPDGTTIDFAISGSVAYRFQAGIILSLSDTAALKFGASSDAILTRAAAQTLAAQNGTTAQSFRVYGTTTGPKYASLAHDGTNMVLSEVGGGNININNADVAAATAVVAHIATSTITGGVTDGFTSGLRLTPTVNAGTALTMTRLNYIDVNQVTLGGAGPAAVTDACVFRFNAAAGTHKAVDAGTTKTSPGTVTQWVKINVNGTLAYIPSYSSKTT